jgi:hypothetical protein
VPGPGAPDVQPLPALSTSTLAARVSQIVGGGPVFSGLISVFPLPDVVEFVRSARRTGLLVCSSQKGMAAVNFREGRITGATSPDTPDVGDPAPRAKDLERGAEGGEGFPAGRPADHVLGERLVREGTSTPPPSRRRSGGGRADLPRARAVEGRRVRLQPRAENEPASAPASIDLDAQEVLLNIFKQMDEDARGAVAPGVQR